MKNWKDLEKGVRDASNEQKYFTTRLRTPNQQYSGIKNPCDFIVDTGSNVLYIECKYITAKTRKLYPSAIAQLPFIKEWAERPRAGKYLVVAAFEPSDAVYIIPAEQIVALTKRHVGITPEDPTTYEKRYDSVQQFVEAF